MLVLWRPGGEAVARAKPHLPGMVTLPVAQRLAECFVRPFDPRPWPWRAQGDGASGAAAAGARRSLRQAPRRIFGGMRQRVAVADGWTVRRGRLQARDKNAGFPRRGMVAIGRVGAVCHALYRRGCRFGRPPLGLHPGHGRIKAIIPIELSRPIFARSQRASARIDSVAARRGRSRLRRAGSARTQYPGRTGCRHR
jgi:hypothetical protein